MWFESRDIESKQASKRRKKGAHEIVVGLFEGEMHLCGDPALID